MGAKKSRYTADEFWAVARDMIKNYDTTVKKLASEQVRNSGYRGIEKYVRIKILEWRYHRVKRTFMLASTTRAGFGSEESPSILLMKLAGIKPQ